MKCTGIICGDHTYLSQLGFEAWTKIDISNIDKADINSINATYDKLIVLCELKKGNITRDRFYGFNVVRMLRLKGAQMPILFISMMPVAGLLETQNIFTKLLLTNGHGFIQLPAEDSVINQALDKIKPLTDTGLKDVQLFSCSPEGMIREKTHHNPVTKDTQHNYKILKNLLTELCQIASTSAESYINDFEVEHPANDFNTEEAFAYIRRTGDTLIHDIESKKTDALPPVSPESQKKPWSLLVLDDELNEDSMFIKEIESRGVTVICTANATDALDRINCDNAVRGRIACILCDYRLLEKRDGIKGFYQPIQGYTFLQQLGEDFQSRLFSAIVYSALPRRFLLETFKDYKLRTEIFSKIDFPPDNSRQTQYLIDRIVETGDQNYEALNALPLNNAGWKSHIHKWYVLLRRSHNYLSIENEISEYCKNWISEYIEGKKPVTPMTKGEQIPQDDKHPEKKMDKLISILKTRRIAIYLYQYFENLHRVERIDIQSKIFELLKNPDRKGATVDSRKRFMSVLLGLSLSDFPVGITIEELNWMHYVMGVNVLNDYKTFRLLCNKLENEIKSYTSKYEYLKKYNECCILGLNDIKNLISKIMDVVVKKNEAEELEKFISFLRELEKNVFINLNKNDNNGVSRIIELEVSQKNFTITTKNKLLNIIKGYRIMGEESYMNKYDPYLYWNIPELNMNNGVDIKEYITDYLNNKKTDINKLFKKGRSNISHKTNLEINKYKDSLDKAISDTKIKNINNISLEESKKIRSKFYTLLDEFKNNENPFKKDYNKNEASKQHKSADSPINGYADEEGHTTILDLSPGPNDKEFELEILYFKDYINFLNNEFTKLDNFNITFNDPSYKGDNLNLNFLIYSNNADENLNENTQNKIESILKEEKIEFDLDYFSEKKVDDITYYHLYAYSLNFNIIKNNSDLFIYKNNIKYFI